eukprot:SAG11_NODE_15001_length_591_cov_8.849593_1_plen_64_part_10
MFGIKLVAAKGGDCKPLGYIRIQSPPKLAKRRVNSQMPKQKETKKGPKEKKKSKKTHFPRAKRA